MLRTLGREKAGLPLREADRQRLSSWLQSLLNDHQVVAYCPDAPAGTFGFYYLPEDARDHSDLSLPIRREPVTPSQIGLATRNR